MFITLSMNLTITKKEYRMTKCILCCENIKPCWVTGWEDGNNAEPIAEGRCCNDCNTTYVIPVRLGGCK